MVKVASERKVRLIAAAYARLFSGHESYPDEEPWVDLMIRVADEPELIERLGSEMLRLPQHAKLSNFLGRGTKPDMELRKLVALTSEPFGWPALRPTPLQCKLIGFVREVVGNPFRRVEVNPHWFTSTVIGLAEVIYIDRVFSRMPILADALMDAGCEDTEILDHCRLPGRHVRGCWVVDLLLGKS